MDLFKKFAFVNPDANNVDGSRLFPLENLNAIYQVDATNVRFVFKDAGVADDTVVNIVLNTSEDGKEFIKEFVEELNFGKESVITLADRSGNVSFSSRVDADGEHSVGEGA